MDNQNSISDEQLSIIASLTDLENRVDGLQLSKCNGLIEIKNVDFSYANEKKFLSANSLELSD